MLQEERARGRDERAAGAGKAAEGRVSPKQCMSAERKMLHPREQWF